MTIRQILKEEILGDMATVFHRGSERKLQRLLDKTYMNTSHIDFEKYDQALYATYNMASQLNTNPDQGNDMQATYGDYIIKLGVKGVSNFWFCDFDKFKQFHKEATLDNWKELQLKKFNIKDNNSIKLLLGKEKEHTANHTLVSKFFEKNNMLRTRVKGIEYTGKNDGECLLIYDWTTAVPLSITSDEGKTWEKIDKSKTEFQRKNLGNNNFISTIKKGVKEKCYFNISKNVPKKINDGLDCSKNNLDSLRGVPEEVGGDFKCDNNNLTSLKFAPKKVGGFFNCGSNKLTSLQGAPKKVGGSFSCIFNNLTSLQGAPEEVGGDFHCDSRNITSLEGAPKKCKALYCGGTKITKEQAIEYLKHNDCERVEGNDFKVSKSDVVNESYFNY